MTNSALLEVEHLVAGYGVMTVLNGVSLRVEKGAAIAVVGGNGAGKTTLIRTIAGMLRPRSGHVRFAGQDITGWPADRICELGLAQVPEGRQLFASQSVEDNLRLGALLKRARASAHATREQVYTLFPKLAERRRQLAGTLSGGEQQMLALARGLGTDPAVLLVDELSMGLAPLIVTELYEAVAAIAETGVSVLVVEQFATIGLRFASTVHVMTHGTVAYSGPTDDAMDAVHAAYLGAKGQDKRD